ncbi:tRNA (adenosine(37)-N6)-threonylcarbamoyltransferase complex dimerization subunit type 1 TsaB, partial [Erysipelatoclostridium ramosum]|nr:tRNA (adenosine(37)-N6)-threonylcarbamoyltransferase complex dimerization subunit type 1 TsaB [Thomasclavelia ramosa]
LVEQSDYQLFGDCELIDEKASEAQFLENFIALRPYYRKVENVHTLTPRYLKESDAYKVKP